jgi:hypothetical protein
MHSLKTSPLVVAAVAIVSWWITSGPSLPGFVQPSTSFAQEDAAAPGADQRSEVSGEIPAEFVGRWVGFASVKLPSGLQRHFGRMWELTKAPEDDPDEYHLQIMFGSLPEGVERRMGEASKDGTAWDATPEDLHEIEEQWASLSTTPGGNYAQVEAKLTEAKEYPEDFERDAITKGSQYAFSFNEVFAQQAVTRTYTIYAIRNREPNRLTGTFITSSTAAAPFPIPITLKGEFAAYRLGGAPAADKKDQSWFQGLFSGCGGS